MQLPIAASRLTLTWNWPTATGMSMDRNDATSFVSLWHVFAKRKTQPQKDEDGSDTPTQERLCATPNAY